jgi:hypothetical protein
MVIVMSFLGTRIMDWRSKFPFVAKKRTELTLTPEQLADLAHVCLDVQNRSIEAFLAGQAKGTQVRHELSMSWLVSYQLTAQPNGAEHLLGISHDGTVPPEFRDALLRDALRLLAYCARVARLAPIAPFDLEASGLAVRRVMLVDQTRKLKRSPELLPSVDALAALFTAACSEAGPLEPRLNEPVRSSPSSLIPQNR